MDDRTRVNEDKPGYIHEILTLFDGIERANNIKAFSDRQKAVLRLKNDIARIKKKYPIVNDNLDCELFNHLIKKLE